MAKIVIFTRELFRRRRPGGATRQEAPDGATPWPVEALALRSLLDRGDGDQSSPSSIRCMVSSSSPK
jgi:hypothetical protein